MKAFLDIQDDNLPKLIVCQSLLIEAGITYGQFVHFLRQSEEQISMVIMEAFANNLLLMGKKMNLSRPISVCPFCTDSLFSRYFLFSAPLPAFPAGEAAHFTFYAAFRPLMPHISRRLCWSGISHR